MVLERERRGAGVILAGLPLPFSQTIQLLSLPLLALSVNGPELNVFPILLTAPFSVRLRAAVFAHWGIEPSTRKSSTRFAVIGSVLCQTSVWVPSPLSEMLSRTTLAVVQTLPSKEDCMLVASSSAPTQRRKVMAKWSSPPASITLPCTAL